MVTGIIGESCTGKSTLADKLKSLLCAEVYTGKDYLRLSKNEAIAIKKGYGTAVAKLCIDFLCKEYKARRVSAPLNQCHTAAQKFWTKLGFAYSDSIEDGYVFMRLNLV